jgi:hypothetical protein
VRFVLNHDRSTVQSSHDDATTPRQRSAEVPLYDGEVAG